MVEAFVDFLGFSNTLSHIKFITFTSPLSASYYPSHTQTIVMTSAPAAKKEGRTKKGRRRFSREDEDGADAGIALDAGGGGGLNVLRAL